jgi:hypothetical protein
MLTSCKAKLGVVAILALVGFLPVSAKTLLCDAAHCRLTAPDGWTTGIQTKSPGDPIFLCAVGSNKRKGEKFFLYAKHADSSNAISADSACVKDAVASCLKNHTKILDRYAQTVNGIDYCVLLYRQDMGGSSYTSGECWLTVKDGCEYELWMDRKNAEASDDGDLTSIIQSLSFSAK